MCNFGWFGGSPWLYAAKVPWQNSNGTRKRNCEIATSLASWWEAPNAKTTVETRKTWTSAASSISMYQLLFFNISMYEPLWTIINVPTKKIRAVVVSRLNCLISFFTANACHAFKMIQNACYPRRLWRCQIAINIHQLTRSSHSFAYAHMCTLYHEHIIGSITNGQGDATPSPQRK